MDDKQPQGFDSCEDADKAMALAVEELRREAQDFNDQLKKIRQEQEVQLKHFYKMIGRRKNQRRHEGRERCKSGWRKGR